MSYKDNENRIKNKLYDRMLVLKKKHDEIKKYHDLLQEAIDNNKIPSYEIDSYKRTIEADKHMMKALEEQIKGLEIMLED